MSVEPGTGRVISVGALFGSVVGVLALMVAAFVAGHEVGQGDTVELERQLGLCVQAKAELTERVAELDQAEVTPVQQNREVPEPAPGEPVAATSAFEVEMTPGQAVELADTGIVVEVEGIDAEEDDRRATISVSRRGAKETATIAVGEQADVAGTYIRAKEIEAARVKLYVEG